MKYTILGSDGITDAEKLSQFKGEVGWSYLAPHYTNGSLYFVDPDHPLEKIGMAFSQNDSQQVESWLKSGEIVKIEALHATQWEGDEKIRFEALVVSPFVLFRPV